MRGDFGERDGFVAAINLTHGVSHVIEAEIYIKTFIKMEMLQV